MRGNPHVRFGERAEETDRPKRRHCASARLDHFYASLLIAKGCSVKAVQRRLGHQSAMETLDTYGHLWPDSDDETRNAVDQVLARVTVATADYPLGLNRGPSGDIGALRSLLVQVELMRSARLRSVPISMRHLVPLEQPRHGYHGSPG